MGAILIGGVMLAVIIYMLSHPRITYTPPPEPEEEPKKKAVLTFQTQPKKTVSSSELGISLPEGAKLISSNKHSASVLDKNGNLIEYIKIADKWRAKSSVPMEPLRREEKEEAVVPEDTSVSIKKMTAEEISETAKKFVSESIGSIAAYVSEQVSSNIADEVQVLLAKASLPAPETWQAIIKELKAAQDDLADDYKITEQGILLLLE